MNASQRAIRRKEAGGSNQEGGSYTPNRNYIRKINQIWRYPHLTAERGRLPAASFSIFLTIMLSRRTHEAGFPLRALLSVSSC